MWHQLPLHHSICFPRLELVFVTRSCLLMLLCSAARGWDYTPTPDYRMVASCERFDWFGFRNTDRLNPSDYKHTPFISKNTFSMHLFIHQRSWEPVSMALTRSSTYLRQPGLHSVRQSGSCPWSHARSRSTLQINQTRDCVIIVILSAR